MGIYLSVPVWPEPPADLDWDSAVVEPAGSLSAEMRCADTVTGQVRGLALLGRSVSKGVRLTRSCQIGTSQAGRRAGSELHYQEYLGERISVNPNRYKDFVFLLCHRFIDKLLLLLTFLAFHFWFSFSSPIAF